MTELDWKTANYIHLTFFSSFNDFPLFRGGDDDEGFSGSFSPVAGSTFIFHTVDL